MGKIINDAYERLVFQTWPADIGEELPEERVSARNLIGRILAAKGGAQYYLPVLQVMDAIVHDSGDIVVVDVRNGQALPDLPPEVYVEVPAHIYREGAEPLPIGPMPLSVRGLVQAVKAYEELTIEAALNGDRGLAIEALMANPLVGSYSRAKPFFDRVLENERPYLPAFFA